VEAHAVSDDESCGRLADRHQGLAADAIRIVLGSAHRGAKTQASTGEARRLVDRRLDPALGDLVRRWQEAIVHRRLDGTRSHP